MIIIENRTVPCNPRSKNYAKGTVVNVSGGSASSIIVAGSDVDIVKTTDSKELTNQNVLSSLRSLDEADKKVLARIIGAESEEELTDDKALSALRVLVEIAENNEALKSMFLRKDIPNSAAELITFLKGIISEDTSYISQLIVGGTSDTVSSGLTEISSEEDTDVVVPSLQETASEIDGSTLGSLTNVNEEVDVQDGQDVFLVKSAGSDKWGKRNVKDFTGKDGVIAYPTMFLNPLTGRLILQVPTNNYENRFAVRNGHLMLIQS